MFKARVVKLRCYWLVGVFLLYVKSVESAKDPFSGHLVPLREVYGSREFMRYCDHDWPIYDVDEFPNRIVAINKRNFVYGGWTTESQVVAPGVFINRNHVLTSYTPFRRLNSIEKHRNLVEFYVTFYKAKWVDQDHKLEGYLLDSVNVTCARQIFPNVSTDFDHGDKFLHLPSYDLMVLKTDPMVEFMDPNGAFLVQDLINQRGFFVIGPQLTEMVLDNATIANTLKFVSLGMIDWDHVYNRNHLHSVKLDTNDRLLEDCEEWFDEVNNFICIKNLEHHIAIGSGAPLFNDHLLIGIGSFTINKGQKSVHAFTDVRNLLDLINNTCTEFDGFPDPEPEPTTTEPPKPKG